MFGGNPEFRLDHPPALRTAQPGDPAREPIVMPIAGLRLHIP